MNPASAVAGREAPPGSGNPKPPSRAGATLSKRGMSIRKPGVAPQKTERKPGYENPKRPPRPPPKPKKNALVERAKPCHWRKRTRVGVALGAALCRLAACGMSTAEEDCVAAGNSRDFCEDEYGAASEVVVEWPVS